VEGIALTERQATIAEFEDFLRTTNNRDGRPYEDGSINAYVSPAKNLDAWLTANGIDGDFTVADTATLNPVIPRVLPGPRAGRDPHAAAEPDPAVQLPAARARSPQPVH
jgi:hypothetical protein